MKYVDAAITFAEVPDEISLCINISNCPNHCEGCHSSYLQKDIGKPLEWGSLNALIHINHGITCVCLMGGDANPSAVNHLAAKVHQLGLKTCWYSGCEKLSKDIDLRNWDFIKLGPYIKEKGPLNAKTTNQKFYKVEIPDNGSNAGKLFRLIDITSMFWK